MQEQTRFTIHLEQRQNYEFLVKFDWDSAADLVIDEPPPLGQEVGPNASRLLAAAVGNCLSASLLFCLKKNQAPENSVTAEVSCVLGRNEKQRLRIVAMAVEISLNGESFEATRLNRCLEMFEDFCVVSASVRQGIPIKVSVKDQTGALLHESA